MSLFKKNPNETAYAGGEKHFIDVIKNQATGDLLIWRAPEEDFNTNSKLIVMPGETAVFIDGGNIVQEFTEGTYELNTNNYPFISRLKNALSGGISTFNCVVYFFRKADTAELKWGTDSPIEVRDKVYNIRTSVRARGSYKVRIDNPSLFLSKLVGNNINYKEQNALSNYFRTQMLTEIKSSVAKFLLNYPQELIGIEAFLSDISKTIQPQVNEMVGEYGLYCSNFSVSALEVDTAKYDQIDSAEIDKIKRQKEAEGEQGYMNTLGSNWDRMKQADIMNNMAKNPGGIGGIGASIGLGAAVGTKMGQAADAMFNSQNQTAAQAPAEDPVETLSKLKKLLDAGLIEQADYDAKKAEILARM